MLILLIQTTNRSFSTAFSNLFNVQALSNATFRELEQQISTDIQHRAVPLLQNNSISRRLAEVSKQKTSRSKSGAAELR